MQKKKSHLQLEELVEKFLYLYEEKEAFILITIQAVSNCLHFLIFSADQSEKDDKIFNFFFSERLGLITYIKLKSFLGLFECLRTNCWNFLTRLFCFKYSIVEN